MKVTYEHEAGGLVWANNPMVMVTTWNTRRWVRAVVVLPIAYLLGGFTFGRIPPFDGPADPLFAAAFVVVSAVYLARPRHADPTFLKRFGFSSAELVAERLGGDVLRVPWPAVLDVKVRVGEGTRMGAEVTVVKAKGALVYSPCNLDLAITVLWARRLASSVGLDPARLPAPPDEGVAAAELPVSGTVIKSDPPLSLHAGQLHVLKRGRLRSFSPLDVDLVPAKMLGVEMLVVGGRGRQISVTSDKAAITALGSWLSGAAPVTGAVSS